jgi:hypothetical protein
MLLKGKYAQDKIQAYQTLAYPFIDAEQIRVPHSTPFFMDKLYRDLSFSNTVRKI